MGAASGKPRGAKSMEYASTRSARTRYGGALLSQERDMPLRTFSI
jgi:hypothetical protein